jgi:3-oxoadipate enol-lactonase
MYDSGDPPGRTADATLLLLHGWTVTAALNWYRCIPKLRERYRVVAMDQRGHGRGVRSRTPFSLEDCADDAAMLLSRMAIDSAIPVGYSMGGPVAMLMWRRHPGLVRGLVLCATAAHFSGSTTMSPRFAGVALNASSALSYIPPGIRNRAMSRATRSWISPASEASWALEERSRHDPSSLVQAGLAMAHFDAREWLGELDAPTGVVITSLDRSVSPGSQWEMARSIPASRVFPARAGHRGCVDDLDEFLPSLLAACRYATGHPDPADRMLTAIRGGPAATPQQLSPE